MGYQNTSRQRIHRTFQQSMQTARTRTETKSKKRKDQERLRTRNRIRQAPGRKKLRITAMAARRIDLTRPVAGSPPCRRGGEREALELDWNFPPSPPGSLVLTSCPLGAQQSTHTGLRRPEWNRTRLAPCRERRDWSTVCGWLLDLFYVFVIEEKYVPHS
jgi:hypothetical protein